MSLPSKERRKENLFVYCLSLAKYISKFIQMNIPEVFKFLIWRFVVTNIFVSIPFLLVLAQLSRLIVQNESEFFTRTVRDVQAFVSFVLVFAGVAMRKFKYRIFGRSLMTVLNFSVGSMSFITTLSLIKDNVDSNVYLAMEITFSILSMISSYLSWCWHFDTEETTKIEKFTA